MSVTPAGININKTQQQQQQHARTESGSSLGLQQQTTAVVAGASSTQPPAATPPVTPAAATPSSALLHSSDVTFNALVAFNIPDTAEGLLAMAKMAELCERWDEMLVCMKRLAKLSAIEEEFGSEERHLLHVAYRNCVLSRRGSWRVAKSMEQRAELECQVDPTPERQSALRVAQEFRVQLENEITDVCTDLILLVENIMFPVAVGDDAKMFLFKLAGDFYRYLAEVNPSGTFAASVSLYSAKPANSSTDLTRDGSLSTTPASQSLLYQQQQQAAAVAAAQQQQDEYWVLAQEAYARATELASALRPSHPMRLSIALNLSIFYYETMRSQEKALSLARQAFTAAISDDTAGETVLEAEANEAGAILQLLQENLFFWTQPAGSDVERL